jgi:phosphonate transport system permease protein
MALMRSVHELLWALLFLAAMGISPAAAVLAIAIPYGGTLAKIVSEMLDESPPQSADALRALGATRLQVFLFGRLPRALPDILAYAFYRFECAVRSSAVLGFFGYATVGLYLKQAFENLHYREVWTYLLSMLLLVLVLEAWSSRLRRSFVA